MVIRNLFVDDSEIVKLILDFLKNKNFLKTYISLEEETKVVNKFYLKISIENFNQEIVFFKNLIFQGDYDEAEYFLNLFKPKLGTVFNSLLYEIKRQQFLELVNSKPDVDLLMKILKEMQKISSPENLKKLCFFLTISSVEEHPEYTDWTIHNGRLKCFEVIRPHIEIICQKGINFQKPLKQNCLKQLLKKLILFEIKDGKQVNQDQIQLFNYNQIINEDINKSLDFINQNFNIKFENNKRLLAQSMVIKDSDAQLYNNTLYQSMQQDKYLMNLNESLEDNQNKSDFKKTNEFLELQKNVQPIMQYHQNQNYSQKQSLGDNYRKSFQYQSFVQDQIQQDSNPVLELQLQKKKFQNFIENDQDELYESFLLENDTNSYKQSSENVIKQPKKLSNNLVKEQDANIVRSSIHSYLDYQSPMNAKSSSDNLNNLIKSYQSENFGKNQDQSLDKYKNSQTSIQNLQYEQNLKSDVDDQDQNNEVQKNEIVKSNFSIKNNSNYNVNSLIKSYQQENFGKNQDLTNQNNKLSQLSSKFDQNLKQSEILLDKAYQSQMSDQFDQIEFPQKNSQFDQFQKKSNQSWKNPYLENISQKQQQNQSLSSDNKQYADQNQMESSQKNSYFKEQKTSQFDNNSSYKQDINLSQSQVTENQKNSQFTQQDNSSFKKSKNRISDQFFEQNVKNSQYVDYNNQESYFEQNEEQKSSQYNDNIQSNHKQKQNQQIGDEDVLYHSVSQITNDCGNNERNECESSILKNEFFINENYQNMIEIAKIQDIQPIRTASFSNNGEYFAIGTNSKSLQIYSLRNILQKNIATDDLQNVPMIFEKKNHHHGSLYSLDWSMNGSLIATGSNDQLIKLIEIEETQDFESAQINLLNETSLVGHTGIVRSLCFSYDETQLYSGGTDGDILIWDTISGQNIAKFLGHKGSVNCIQLAADGKLLASCGIDKSIKLWDLNSNKIAMNISINDYAELNYLSMSEGTLNYSLKNIIKQAKNDHYMSSQQLISAAHNNGLVTLWDIKKQQCIDEIQIHSKDCRSVEFNPSGSHICTTSFDSTLIIYDILNKQIQNVIRNHSDRCVLAKWHPFYPFIISCSADKTARLFASQDFMEKI